LLKGGGILDEFLYDLKTIQLIRQAVSSTYCNVEDTEKFIECIYIIDEIENKLIARFIDANDLG